VTGNDDFEGGEQRHALLPKGGKVVAQASGRHWALQTGRNQLEVLLGNCRVLLIALSLRSKEEY
jgi:hypothetical protein